MWGQFRLIKFLICILTQTRIHQLLWGRVLFKDKVCGDRLKLWIIGFGV
jgi:hypothetical protein